MHLSPQYTPRIFINVSPEQLAKSQTLFPEGMRSACLKKFIFWMMTQVEQHGVQTAARIAYTSKDFADEVAAIRAEQMRSDTSV